MKLKSKNRKNLIKGQLMITTVLILGGVVISAASLLGFLIVHKLRQVTDITDSAKAVFASDAGREWEYWQALKLGERLSLSDCPHFNNNAGFKTAVWRNEDGNMLYILSTGESAKNVRVSGWHLNTNNNTPTSSYLLYPTDQSPISCF